MRRASLIAVLLLALAGTVRAQPRPIPIVSDDVARDLLRLVAHEAGLDSPADADGIWAVWVRGAEREQMSIPAFARAYSRRAFAGTDREINQWAMELELDCSRPPSFRLPWAEPRRQPRHHRHDDARAGVVLPPRRDACLALVEHVRAVVAAPVTCEADDWGSAADYRARRDRGVHDVMVVCAPGARNLFSRRGGR